MYSIEYNKEGGYFFWELSGEVSKQDFFDCIDQMSEFHKENKEIVIFQVDKGSVLDFGPIGNLEIAKYANQYFHLFDSIKCALVTDRSKNVAFFILGMSSLLNSKLDAKVFSTKEKALEWL